MSASMRSLSSSVLSTSNRKTVSSRPLMGGSLLQHAVHKLDADGPFADRRGHTLHASRAYVADGKNARDARLHKVRSARQRPARRDQILRAQIRSDAHK